MMGSGPSPKRSFSSSYKRSRASAADAQDESSLATSSSSKRRKITHASPDTRPTSSISKHGMHTKSKEPGFDAYEVPDSDDEDATLRTRVPDPDAGSHATPTKSSSRRTSKVYEQTETPSRKTPKTSSGEKRRANGMHGSHKKRGNESNSRANQQAQVEGEAVTPKSVHPSTESTAGEESSTMRTSGRRRVPTAKAREGPDLFMSKRGSGAESASRSRSGSVLNTNGNGNGNPMGKTQQAESAAARKVSTPLKGILTPSKRGAGGRRKSVAFGSPDREKEQDSLASAPVSSFKLKLASKMGSPKKGKKASSPEPEPESEEDGDDDVEATEQEEKGDDDEDADEDDEVCAICSDPKSKATNPIMFCDGCDMAVHQKCYGVDRIPEGDWFCKKCVSEKQAKAKVGTKLPNFEQHLRSLQRVLLDRCTGRRRIKVIDQDEPWNKTHQLLEQTVLAGEGNSMLVIGARGSGKTTLVESVIDNLSSRHRNEFHVVRLNGFVHTDDKLALKEVWRQLGREMDVEDGATAKTNYADTMASLLALLSHPSEISQAEDGVTSKAVIFVIDEFDMFASHSRQTLLYNLFDVAQARKAPIAVLGCTTRMDVVEMLEKRVKSRFSHRYVYLSLPKNLPAYWQVCKQGLTVDAEDLESEGIDVGIEGHNEFYASWNRMIEDLYKGKPFQNTLRYYYHTSKSVAAFLSACVQPLAALRSGSMDLEIPGKASTIDSHYYGDFSNEVIASSFQPPNSKLHLLPSLSELDIALLIAAARLDIVAHTDTVNFAMAYDEYSQLMGRQRVQSATSGMLAVGGGARVWSRGVAGVAWERLVALGLLLPAGIGGRGAGGHGGLGGRMWKVDVALEDIPAGARLSQVLARWCKEI